MFKHLNAVTSFSPILYCLKAKSDQSSGVAAVAKFSPVESSSLFKQSSIVLSCWRADYTVIFCDRSNEGGIELFDIS